MNLNLHLNKKLKLKILENFTQLWKLFSLTSESFMRSKWKKNSLFIHKMWEKEENIFQFSVLPHLKKYFICLFSGMNERCAGKTVLITAPQRI